MYILSEMYIRKCRFCRKERAKSLDQKKADLPKHRVTPDEPAFIPVGVDYFGPIEIKRGRANVKRYGVLFTCLRIRAVHLKVAASLDTDSCINAIRRLIARRGSPKVIMSDNGTNLVGSERELREELAKWDQTQIEKTMLQKGITWHFNPLSA